jgi:Glycosyl transferase family 90
MSMADQSRRKYIVHIDGNVSAYRLATTLATGSLILRVASDYTSWLDEYLRAGEHYIAIDADLTNLIETIEWCRSHDEECAKIAARGREVALWAMGDGRVCAEIQMALWRLYSPAKKSAPAEVSVPIDTLTGSSKKCADGTQKTKVAGRRMCKLKE